MELPRDVQACPRCGVIERHAVHDWRWHTVRHLPVAGRVCRVWWHKRLLACTGGCGTFVERTPSISPGTVWSRAAARSAVAMSADNIPIDRIRRTFGVAWNTVMRAVRAAADRITPLAPTRVGIDETVMTTGRLTTRPWRNFTSFKTYWLANDSYGSWHARREMVSEVFDPIHQRLEEREDSVAYNPGIVEAVTSHVQLGWPQADAEIEQIRRSFQRARSPLEYREVGLACVALLEVLSEVCYQRDRHLYDGEEEPPVRNTKQRLSRVIEHEFADRDLGKELGRLVKRAAELSQAVKHSPTRSRVEAGITADTVFLIANILRRLTPASPE